MKIRTGELEKYKKPDSQNSKRRSRRRPNLEDLNESHQALVYEHNSIGDNQIIAMIDMQIMQYDHENNENFQNRQIEGEEHKNFARRSQLPDINNPRRAVEIVQYLNEQEAQNAPQLVNKRSSNIFQSDNR